MTSPNLAIHWANASYELRHLAAQVDLNSIDLATMSLIAEKHRIKAIGALLLTFDVDEFKNNLRDSAAAFIHYLKHTNRNKLILSRCAGFFDALAIAEFNQCRHIANLLYKCEYQPDYESKEDYLFCLSLMNLLLNENESDPLQAYREYIDNETTYRFLVLQALADKNERDFNDAFCDLVNDRKEYYQELIQYEDITDQEWATDGQVYVEGMGLLQFAKMRGMAITDQYLFIPPLL